MKSGAVLVAAWLCAAPVWGQSDPAALAREASDYLDQAALALSQADGARDRIAALTQTVRAYEKGLAAMRESLRQAALAERVGRQTLAGYDQELTQLLAALQSIERSGSPIGVLHPDGPLPAIRAGMLAGDLVPALNARAVIVAGELDDLSALIALQSAGRDQLEAGVAQVRTARLALTQAVSNRTDLPVTLATDDAAMQALINSAETLAAFADNLVGDVPWTGAWTDAWPMPVIGRLVRGFGEADAAGVERPGWTVATDAAALVSAPTEATVRFAGALPDFGVVAILEPRAGELLILSGLGQAYVRRNQIVSKGEPIGLMPGGMDPEQEKLIESSVVSGQPGQETLYIETRQGRDAIDPATRFDLEAE